MKTSISSLPTEVVEIILVIAAVDGFPSAIGALSQTCRAFHTLTYDAADHHLWRTIFLSTFDDPRRLKYYVSGNFDWCDEFKERTWAASFLKRHVRPLRVQKIYTLRTRTTATSLVDLTPTYEVDSSVRMLNALLSVIKTTAPNEHGPGQGEESKAVEGEVMIHKRSLSYAHHAAPDFPERPRGYSKCLNVPWLRAVLEHGLPASLITKISSDTRDLRWDKTPEALALGELIACTGFIPVRNLIEERTGRLASSSSGSYRPEPRSPSMSDMDMSAESQRLRARYCARELVYRMAYLSRRRHWGPYLPVAPSAEDEPILRDSSHAPAATDAPRVLHFSPDDEDTIASPDYVDASDDEVEEPPLVDLVQSRKRKRVVPTPEQLRPDWSWLAAARILVEDNFSDVEEYKIADLVDWNFWRETWANHADDEEPRILDEELPVIGTNGMIGKSPGLGPQCRDWAGAQGVWRRAVLWLDYADLMHHNHFGGFSDPGLYECKIVVPLRLRIVGYDAPSVAAYPDRPTILVEGEMGGQSFEGYEDGTADDIRRVHGAVSMLSTGHVRWNLTSSEEDDPDKDLWASEGIQVGAVGSDAGILGMWTGVRHEQTDPLGAFWQWRVV
ncbi:uncharacterized protein C8Q71DRAFT_740270 [Rhodofomes roseus]|uniref:F-box domain-containing protein n=1 Tax=Rhodofomes roseus TaxID=34475 RepID=A0ABQ8KR67_9APHY|nr:uncharacterized protein C8Q71DRAFT_740270 [Rhodofomes roseus]KAH9840610.1 hypothetical protein C8Q71DRAFT_740270 [Rhodofomes roseus]